MTRNVGREFDQCLDYKIREQAQKETEEVKKLLEATGKWLASIKEKTGIYDYQVICDQRNDPDVPEIFIEPVLPVRTIKLNPSNFFKRNPEYMKVAFDDVIKAEANMTKVDEFIETLFHHPDFATVTVSAKHESPKLFTDLKSFMICYQNRTDEIFVFDIKFKSRLRDTICYSSFTHMQRISDGAESLKQLIKQNLHSC